MENDAYEALVYDLYQKQARRAFEGIVSMMWASGIDPREIKAMLEEQIEYCDEVI